MQELNGASFQEVMDKFQKFQNLNMQFTSVLFSQTINNSWKCIVVY